jgi:hypothetical protein
MSAIPELSKLNEEEFSIITKAPAYVSLLIAGADSNIDRDEIKEAISVTKLKQNRARKELLNYYQAVAPDFEKTLTGLLNNLPKEPEERSKLVVEELKKLNTILPKLDKQFAIQFHASMRDIARKVAEASGGVFGYMAIGYEESKLIDLKMINDPAK